MTSKCAALELRQNDELRIVLVGKTGVGKSAVGNTILGREAFLFKPSPSSVTSECVKVSRKVDKQWVAVIDTPGVFDTKLTKEEVLRKIKSCICLSAPGPHVFLIVLQMGRFTEEEKVTVEIIQTTFGKQAAKYAMVLFTHGDQLGDRSIEGYKRESPELQRLVAKCNNMYHVFNNKDQNPSQVTELLKKMNNMVTVNGGSHYTTEMFQEAERAIEEEKNRILKENKDKRRKEEQQMIAEFIIKVIEQMDEKYKREARNEAEKINQFIKGGRGGSLTGALAGAGAGGAIGAKIGSPMGVPGRVAGVLVGVVVGGLAGGLVGAVAGAEVIQVSDKCSIQ